MEENLKTMKAWQLHAFGLENLTLDNVDIPAPKHNEILIKVGAVSLNFRDKAIVDGIYTPDKIQFPVIPVSDTSGTVVAIGSGVNRFKIGDRVTSHLYSHWIDGKPADNEQEFSLGSPLSGGLAEYMILEEGSTVFSPSSLNDEEASTLPIAALTPWYSMVTCGNLKTGETVVLQGTGGVSIFGLQIAHALGAKTILTTSDDEKGQKAKDLGADEIVNYKQTPDWATEVLNLTNGIGADQILDIAGGEGLNDSVRAAKVGGQVSVIGFLQGQNTNLDLMNVIFKRTRVQGIAVGHLKAFEEMNKAFDKYNIKPVIEKIYSFEEAIEAYQHLAKGAFGKIVIKIS
ncbi:zinc-dependent alcohol dehydrogenase family protein [Flavobacterium soyae]|uniref:NAD(P)-dependent alcohol dehydrogenase n=1 Tax=Flavobacterium soyae TaxID=2903098 RepID=A0ABZ2UIW3_9FLAO|nr:NAD(P)-dependent alcohol dehydrogenase [Flavobacterium soyae]MCD9573681.1 NAD(P)-dependent alcohol dehydrogenase [Flavobacterium soyae]